MFRTLRSVHMNCWTSCRLSYGIDGQLLEKYVQRYVCRFNSNQVLETDDLHLDDFSEKFVAVTDKEKKKYGKGKPDQPPNAHVLRVAVVGAPNAGKSTLANRLIGHRFAAVSSKVHTTRECVAGVLTEFNKQLIFLDTPGMIHPSKRKKHKLERTLLVDPHASLFQADIIAVVADISNPWGRGQLDKEILKALHLHSNKKSVLILNKIDTMKNKEGLFRVTRLLTEGIVDGRRESIKASDIYKKASVKEMFDKVDKLKGDMHTNSTKSSEQVLTAKELTPEKRLENESSYVELGRSIDYHNKEDTGDLFNTDIVPDLWNSQDWHAYHTRLREVSAKVVDKKGWPGFSALFMISAIDGDGIEELKNYFMRSTHPGDWVYDKRTVTNVEPLEIAKMCVWEKVLDRVPNDIAYIVRIVPSVWEVNEDGLLCASFDIVCRYDREAKSILGPQGDTIKKISMEVKQELMNTFRREMTLKLAVKSRRNN